MSIDYYYFSKYKCFVEETKIASPKLVNLIIGKNNSGKSTFLDVFRFILSEHVCPGLDKIYFSYVISQKDIEKVKFYNRRTYGVDIRGNIITESPTLLIGKSIIGSYNPKLTIDVNEFINRYYNLNNYYFVDQQTLANNIYNHFHHHQIVTVAAERDIKKEEKDNDANVDPHGNNFTKVLERLAHNQNSKRVIIENILKALNDILDGDEHYDSLEVLEDNGEYVISLGEKYKEIPITNMGSGLKTLLIVLFHLEYAKLYDTNPVFMFEELENNLHPEIQRRLFTKIYDYAIQNNTQMFITTHSNVAINCIYGRDNTALYHVKKDKNNKSTISAISSIADSYDTLNDLGVRASDIFQSNGIIWVEGPSDRIYLKAWLKIIDPTLEENKHFSFLYYGGRNLAHFSADEVDGLINVLLTNRNSAIVIDSDIKDKDNIKINDTKVRIKNEFTSKNMFCWITEGREIENYISSKVIDKKYSSSSHSQIDKYEDFKDYIKNDNATFDNNKVAFAKSLNFEKIEEIDVLDLKEKLQELATLIHGWNS